MSQRKISRDVGGLCVLSSDHRGNQEFIFMMANPTSPPSPATDVRERVYLLVVLAKH